MAKFTNEQLAAMARPDSLTEEQKLENAENAVKNALSNYTLAAGNYEVFGQGSYAKIPISGIIATLILMCAIQVDSITNFQKGEQEKNME